MFGKCHQLYANGALKFGFTLFGDLVDGWLILQGVLRWQCLQSGVPRRKSRDLRSRMLRPRTY